ncbi:aminoglycoside phosphotransferase family protein [Nonomuraea sp. NPDC049421]|uniref:phosphotransferase family protein n=1 Tax=Nonomuraea sp. NPDC049421 TaxID=3155275 RepID=UPI00342E3933
MNGVPVHGGFTEAQLSDLLRRACDAAGLRADGAVVLRGQTNAVIRLQTAPVIVKIARVGTEPAEVERTVRFVSWLMKLGFPTVPLYRPEIQPLLVDGHAITLWDYLPQPPEPVPTETLAKPLSRLHSLDNPPVSLPQSDAIQAIRRSLRATTLLPEPDLRFLQERVDQLEAELANVQYALDPNAIIQGDPHHRNALHRVEGVVLCDWDSASIGQPEWDLITIEVHCRRFGYGQSSYNDFAQAYGFDVAAWSGYRVLRDLRELRMITTNARKSIHASEKAAEVIRRVRNLRQGAHGMAWNIL